MEKLIRSRRSSGESEWHANCSMKSVNDFGTSTLHMRQSQHVCCGDGVMANTLAAGTLFRRASFCFWRLKLGEQGSPTLKFSGEQVVAGVQIRRANVTYGSDWRKDPFEREPSLWRWRTGCGKPRKFKHIVQDRPKKILAFWIISLCFVSYSPLIVFALRLISPFFSWHMVDHT